MTEPGSGDDKVDSDPDPLPDTPSFPSRRQVQKAHRQAHRHPWLRRGSIALAGALVLVLVLGVLAYVKLNSNITKLDVTKLLGKRPSITGSADKITNLKPLNILVMGVDTRDLGTTKYGIAPGNRSDTNIVVHLAADRKSAVVVSIPRDSMTRAPRNCKDPNSTVSGGPMRQWNANFGLGGPACVIRTLEGNSGIFIDHFMVVNFLGFKSMVDALGSVEVCLPEAVNDPNSNLKLPAGRSRVKGDQALSFVRVRYNIGKDGSDLGRINRQQAFLSSMVQEATSRGLLLRPDKLYRFLDAATRSLTTDPGMADFSDMRELAQSVIGLKTSQVRFVTVPNEPYPPDPGRVQWTSAAKALWTSIREDAPLPGTRRAPSRTPTGSATKAPALLIRPDKITVRLTNASGVAGGASQAGDDLRVQGFHVAGISTGATLKEGVTVTYWAPFYQEARTVAAAFPGATLVQSNTPSNDIQVTLGVGSSYVVQVPNAAGGAKVSPHPTAPTPSSTVTIKARTADSNICSQ